MIRHLGHFFTGCRNMACVVGAFAWVVTPAPATAAEAHYQDKRLACEIVGADVMEHTDGLSDEEWHKDARARFLACLSENNICGYEPGLDDSPDLFYEGNRTAEIPATGSVDVLARSVENARFKVCTVLSVQHGSASGWNRTSWVIYPNLTEKEKWLGDRCRTERIDEVPEIEELVGDHQTPRRIAVEAWKVLEVAIATIEFESSMGPCEGVTAEECAEAEGAEADERAEKERALTAGARKTCDQ